MNFSDAEEEQLINCVILYPPLYDTRDTNYRNNFLKDDIWKEISKEINKTSEDCRKKWKMIRDSYIRYRKKSKGGTGSVVAKNAKDKRHQQLSFLDNIPEYRWSTNIRASPPNVTDNENSVDLNYQERESPDQDTEDFETSQILNETPKAKRVKHSDDNILTIWKEINEKKQDLMKTIIQRKDDDVQLFCDYIGNVLRNLPPLQKAEAKKHIGSVVADYEILAAKAMSEN